MNDVFSISRKFVEEVKNTGINVVDAYLYGSHAKKIADADSDIDVCIISPDLGKDLIDEMIRLKQISRRVDDRIETVPLGPVDFSNPFDPLVFEIKKSGIKIL